MKKFVAVLLAVVAVFSFSTSAFAAVGSITAPPATETGEKAAALPTVVETEEVELTPVDKVEDLPEDAQKEFKEANDKIKDAIPEGMVARHVCYVENTKSEKGEFKVTFKLEDIKDLKDVVFKLFKDGKWIELEVVMNEDGTFTVVIPANGPLAVCTKK